MCLGINHVGSFVLGGWGWGLLLNLGSFGEIHSYLFINRLCFIVRDVLVDKLLGEWGIFSVISIGQI